MLKCNYKKTLADLDLTAIKNVDGKDFVKFIDKSTGNDFAETTVITADIELEAIYEDKVPQGPIGSTVDTTSYVSFPWIIRNGAGKPGDLSVYSWEYDGSYEMYYQFVEVSDEVYNKIIALNEKYENDEITYEEYFVQYNETVTKYNDNNWIKTEDGSFERNLSDYTGEKKFALWVKLVMEDKTVYEAQIYKMNGSGAASNVPEEIEGTEDKEETKDKTKAPGSLPYTGGTFVIIVSVLAIIALGIYAYRRNNDLKGI